MATEVSYYLKNFRVTELEVGCTLIHGCHLRIYISNAEVYEKGLANIVNSYLKVPFYVPI